MTADQFGGVLRALLAFGAGFIPATFMDAGTTATIVGALVTLGVTVWSWKTNKASAA